MDASKQRKKRRKHSRNQSDGDGHRRRPSGQHSTDARGGGRQQQQQQHHQLDRQRKHQEALALSQQLRLLSSKKRLKECIDLFRSPANDEVRDAHHGSIVVDCCARCGDVGEAETIVHEMLQRKKPGKKDAASLYFWEEHKSFSYKDVPIQAWTALLKGYVHAGMMAKADSLFCFLCSTNNPAAAGDGGENVGRKRKRTDSKNGPNVRTLNTLLRGCLWTATTLNSNGVSGKRTEGESSSRNELVGGVATAERAWSLSNGNITRDTSSYEYYISVLSQALQCKRAEECLQHMRREFGISENDLDGADPSMLESVVVCLVVIARGYALLGKMSDGRRCAGEALRCLDASAGTSSLDGALPGHSTAKKQATGGKKSWRDSGAGATSKEDCSAGRREESNTLFRSHRLSELKSEAQNLSSFCSSALKESGATENVAQSMLKRLLYFSGGGTTGKDATEAANDAAKGKAEEDSMQTQVQSIHSLWHSFGLKEMVSEMLGDKRKKDALTTIFHSSSPKKHTKKLKREELPPVLSQDACRGLRSHLSGAGSVIKSDGHMNIDFAEVFESSKRGNKLHIELGAGSGDWAALQAELNPSGNYVTVELRADRVAQTFAKAMLHQQREETAPLTNLCCVGSECGTFLRDRVEPGSVSTIFINHPEPPTQTTTSDDIGAEEPAHMLNSQTILSAARCLEPNGKGRLIIVTDNLIYARLICATIARVQEASSTLVCLPQSDTRSLRQIGSFGRSSIRLYEGKPSLSIGHYVDKRGHEGGTSYFDRLWRTGATKHADMRKRFIIALRATGGNDDESSSGIKAAKHRREDTKKVKSEGKKPNKKRSAEKQRLRNERRLLKKQQLAQMEES